MTRLRRERSRSYLGRSARLRSLDQGSLTEVSRETARKPQNPKVSETAPLEVISRVDRAEVSRVHSSSLENEGTNMNDLRRSDEQLRRIDEPGWGRWRLAC